MRQRQREREGLGKHRKRGWCHMQNEEKSSARKEMRAEGRCILRNHSRLQSASSVIPALSTYHIAWVRLSNLQGSKFTLSLPWQPAWNLLYPPACGFHQAHNTRLYEGWPPAVEPHHLQLCWQEVSHQETFNLATPALFQRALEQNPIVLHCSSPARKAAVHI